MLAVDPPPSLILPDYWEAKRPAIIRPGNDILRAERERMRLAGVLPGIGGLLGGAVAPPKVTYLGGFANAGSIVVPRPGILVVMAGGWRNGSGIGLGHRRFAVASVGFGGHGAELVNSEGLYSMRANSITSSTNAKLASNTGTR